MHALRRVAAVLLVTTLAGLPAASTAARGSGAKCFGRTPTIVGSKQADRLEGTRGRDVIIGRGGSDRIDGRGGDDLICAGRGADRVDGGRGADRLHGGPDRLVRGAAGNHLVGDVLAGGRGNDFLEGGADSRDASRRRPDTFSWSDARRRVVVDLSGAAEPGLGSARGRGRDTIVLGPAHGIVGSRYADDITGSPVADLIHGGDGADTIRAGGGADRVRPDGTARHRGRDRVDTGSGADLVSSLAGRDVIATGRGRDFVEAFSPRPTRVDLGAGRDYLGQNITRGAGASADGGPGDDIVTFYGTLLAGQRPRARFVIDHRAGTTRVTGRVRARGRIARMERHRLVGPLRWQFHGSAAADRVWAIQGGPLRALTYGGRDDLVGSDRSDLLAGGSGSDHADGRGGRDDCRSIERGSC